MYMMKYTRTKRHIFTRYTYLYGIYICIEVCQPWFWGYYMYVQWKPLKMLYNGHLWGTKRCIVVGLCWHAMSIICISISTICHLRTCTCTVHAKDNVFNFKKNIYLLSISDGLVDIVSPVFLWYTEDGLTWPVDDPAGTLWHCVRQHRLLNHLYKEITTWVNRCYITCTMYVCYWWACKNLCTWTYT